MKILNTIVAASLAAASLPGQQGNQPAKPPVVTSIDSVDLAGVGTDHVRFEVHARATATRGVTVARIKFEEMRLGDIPFYLSPIDQKLQLKSGQAAALPSLGMTIYFRIWIPLLRCLKWFAAVKSGFAGWLVRISILI